MGNHVKQNPQHMLEPPMYPPLLALWAVTMRAVRKISRLDGRKPLYPNDHNEDSDDDKPSDDGMV